MNALWNEIKNQLKPKLPKNTFSLWINSIDFLEKKEDKFVLGCPNKFACNWVSENYFGLIQEKVHETAGEHLDLILEVVPKKRKAASPYFLRNSEQLVLPNIPMNETPKNPLLKNNFTFASFIVGPCNEFAYTASKTIALRSSSNYHSLLMHGNTGLGKSHLSQAVGHTILTQEPTRKVIYMTAEDFTDEMVSALQNNRIQAFKNKYHRSCDVLLLEEIHLLSGRERTQRELASTLDALINDNKRIIFTSTVPPKDIPRISGQLSSRLTSGLVTGVEMPDYETRSKILTKKASQLGITISKETIHLMATSLKGDVRQMEGALKSLKAKSGFLAAKIDQNMAKEVIDCLVSSETSVSLEEIQTLVCRYYKIEPAMLRSKSRKKVHASPRNIYAYLCRKITEETIANIAQTINRSHSTVLYASELVERKMKTDTKMRYQVDLLRQKLEAVRR